MVVLTFAFLFLFQFQFGLSSLNLDECIVSDGNRKGVVERLRRRKERSHYTIVDVGGSMNSWSSPVADAFVDITVPPRSVGENLTFFKADIQNPRTWGEIKEYVRVHGKFNFSICSHTLEDLSLPSLTMRLLEDISHEGFIATPTKYRELCYPESNTFRLSSLIFTPPSSILNLTQN